MATATAMALPAHGESSVFSVRHDDAIRRDAQYDTMLPWRGEEGCRLFYLACAQSGYVVIMLDAVDEDGGSTPLENFLGRRRSSESSRRASRARRVNDLRYHTIC